jgi:beta-lactamase superfamily II metal-dependent hydrolase
MPSDCGEATPVSVGSVTIRMYDLQGEGDCFLLTFKISDGSKRFMLIDCGIFTGTPGGKDKLQEVAKNIMETTGNHIHTLVVTHEHWDHIAGFQYAVDTFFDEPTKIDELWLAWTENIEGDELAKLLNKKYEPIQQALEMTTQLAGFTERFDAQSIRNVLAYKSPLSLEEGLSMTTTKLMDKIHEDLSSKVTYTSPDNPPRSLPEYPGVRFYTLGPPRDENQLKILEASGIAVDDIMLHDEATYFNIAVSAAFGEGKLSDEQHKRYVRLNKRSMPFGDELGLTKKEAKEYIINDIRFFEEHYGFKKDDPEKAWRRINYDWLASSEQLALYMDNYVNNTSLVIAIELTGSGNVLLFPGDAQYGNWDSWKDLTWTIENEQGESKDVEAMDLIKKTVFYKVGHHGSHNGTLKTYLRQMNNKLVVMIPCNEKWALDKRKWNHPDPGLLPEIEAKTMGRIIRSDTHVPTSKPDTLTLNEWTEFTGDVKEEQNGLWIEYTVHNK